MNSKSERAFTKTFRLSGRLSIEMTVGPAGYTCEWDPDIPIQLTAREQRRYLRARHEMMRRLAEMLGGTVLVVMRGPEQPREGEGG